MEVEEGIPSSPWKLLVKPTHLRRPPCWNDDGTKNLFSMYGTLMCVPTVLARPVVLYRPGGVPCGGEEGARLFFFCFVSSAVGFHEARRRVGTYRGSLFVLPCPLAPDGLTS